MSNIDGKNAITTNSSAKLSAIQTNNKSTPQSTLKNKPKVQSGRSNKMRVGDYQAENEVKIN